jgi:hypothetical protein
MNDRARDLPSVSRWSKPGQKLEVVDAASRQRHIQLHDSRERSSTSHTREHASDKLTSVK